MCSNYVLATDSPLLRVTRVTCTFRSTLRTVSAKPSVNPIGICYTCRARNKCVIRASYVGDLCLLGTSSYVHEAHRTQAYLSELTPHGVRTDFCSI